MNIARGDIHVVMVHLEDEDKLARAVQNGFGVETVCEDRLNQFRIVPVVAHPSKICPKCQAAMAEFEHKHGYRFHKHFVVETLKTETIVSIPVKPFALVSDPQYE